MTTFLTKPARPLSDGPLPAGGAAREEHNSEKRKHKKPKPTIMSEDRQRYLDALARVEELLDEHIQFQNQGTPYASRLQMYVPSVGAFFTRLPLREAFAFQDERSWISARQFVPPSFNDIRRILNTAQIKAVAKPLKLITFDGDVTLYEDGADLLDSSPITALLIRLLQHGLRVAIVTAAGYKEHTRYEQRLRGLLSAFRAHRLPQDVVARFHVLGGECNYLLHVHPPDGDHGVYRLQQDHDYRPPELQDFTEQELQQFLDTAEQVLRKCIRDMDLQATTLRKERAVGLVASTVAVSTLVERRSSSPASMGVTVPPLPYQLQREQLDECVLRTQHVLRRAYTPDTRRSPPYCVFNGGRDVWVDLGNKLIGVQALQTRFQAAPQETLHVGDQFLGTGNDLATRSTCCTIWVAKPAETETFLDELLLERMLVEEEGMGQE